MLLCKSTVTLILATLHLIIAHICSHKWEGDHNGNCWKSNKIMYNTIDCYARAGWFHIKTAQERSERHRLVCGQFVIQAGFVLLYGRGPNDSSCSVMKGYILLSDEGLHKLQLLYTQFQLNIKSFFSSIKFLALIDQTSAVMIEPIHEGLTWSQYHYTDDSPRCCRMIQCMTSQQNEREHL